MLLYMQKNGIKYSVLKQKMELSKKFINLVSVIQDCLNWFKFNKYTRILLMTSKRILCITIRKHDIWHNLIRFQENKNMYTLALIYMQLVSNVYKTFISK